MLEIGGCEADRLLRILCPRIGSNEMLKDGRWEKRMLEGVKEQDQSARRPGKSMVWEEA